MKKYIFIIMIALCVCVTAIAQNSFYYYRGTKLQLTENPQKIVIISKNNTSTESYAGLTLAKSINGTKNKIRVYETVSSTANAKQLKSAVQSASGNISVTSCYINEYGKELIPTGYIHVKLLSENDRKTLENTARQYGLEIFEQNRFMPLWYSLRQSDATGMSPIEIANKIYETGLFQYSSPDFAFDALEFSYDPDNIHQWGLYNSQYEGLDISISEAWNYATGRGINIAIIDVGIETTHQDLAANIHPVSYDTETHSSPSKLYNNNHGTHCAGIAAAVRNNGIQIAGVAPDAKIMPISNRLSLSEEETIKLADGINWAWKNGADVISCSWWCMPNEAMEEAIDSAVTRGRDGKGCVFVKSAGNTSGAISYPGSYRKEVLAIASMAINGTLASSSASGDNLFVTAPGVKILSTVLNNSTAYMSGTPMAAPHVAGLAALILERNPSLTAYQVRKIIAQNTKKIGYCGYYQSKEFGTWNEHYGYGLIDAYKSVLNTPR